MAIEYNYHGVTLTGVVRDGIGKIVEVRFPKDEFDGELMYDNNPATWGRVVPVNCIIGGKHKSASGGVYWSGRTATPSEVIMHLNDSEAKMSPAMPRFEALQSMKAAGFKIG